MTDTQTRVAYLLKRFPRLSETFILHEMLELERQGVALRVYSIMNPGEKVIHSDVSRLRAPIHYLPSGPRAALKVARAHLSVIRRHPRRYLMAVAHVLRRRLRTSAVKHFWRAGWLAWDLDQAGASHLHAHFAHGPASVAHVASIMLGLPFSFTGHAKDIYTTPSASLINKIEAARFVITCTDYNVQYLSSLNGSPPPGRIHRIYHGVDLHKFAPRAPDHTESGACSNTPLILAVGRLVEKKGFPYLIEAMGDLRRRGYAARLQIIGDGEMRASLACQIAAAGLEEHIALLEPRPQEALVDVYRAATVCVLPCVVTDNGDRDGIPNVLVEAMRLGVPVVSTLVSGIPELITNDQTGLLVPPRDARALADSVARLLDDACLRERLADAAAQYVLREFDLASNATRLRGLLEGIVA